MLVPYSWLKEFIEIEASPKELAHRLTMAGLEVEGLERGLPCLQDVVVARVVQVEPHPSREGLAVCTVDRGQGELQVVCGAPNLRPGMATALALPGAELVGGVVKAATIHGVESNGMLCSERELLLGEDHSGIMELSDGEAGQPLAEALELDEWIFEIGITPNRSDCLSILGVAREAATLYQKDLGPVPGADPVFGEGGFSVAIEAPELCRRYCGAVIKGIEVRPSPVWLQRRLHAAGIRPINNIVDATNYVMLELGQPLHAFDLDTLRGGRIVVRLARDGEEITTLDGRHRTLTSSMLVIADGERPVAVAGVMGGAETEVTDGTRNILLESAWFTPGQIRRTAKALKLPTEASYRFERGIDPEMTPKALARAVELIAELAGGTVEKPWTDCYPSPWRPRHVEADPARIESLLGAPCSVDEISSICRSLGFQVLKEGEERLRLQVPSWRWDISEEADIVEEVARIKGYDSLPTTIPKAPCWEKGPANGAWFERKLKGLMSGLGLNEIIYYSFISPKEIKAMGFRGDDPRRSFVRLKNPLTEEQSVMRTHLLPSLLGAVSRNIAHRSNSLRLFELGKVFLEQEDGALPREETRLSCVMTGSRFPLSWAWPQVDVDLFDLKGVVETLLRRLGVEGWLFRLSTPDDPYYLPGSSTEILVGDSTIGTMGAVSPQVLKGWDIEQELFCCDLSVERLMELYRSVPTFRPLPEYPAMERDVAMVVDDSVEAGAIYLHIAEARPRFLEEYVIFDCYRGKPIPKGKKSIAIRLRYRANDRTLTEEELAPIHEKLVNSLLSAFHGELRA